MDLEGQSMGSKGFPATIDLAGPSTSSSVKKRGRPVGSTGTKKRKQKNQDDDEEWPVETAKKPRKGANKEQATGKKVGKGGGKKGKVETVVQTNPLLMTDILPHIFKKLSGDGVQNARKVCRMWKAEANKSLFMLNSVCVPDKLRQSQAMAKWAERFQQFGGKFSAVNINQKKDLNIFKQLKILPSKQVEKIRLDQEVPRRAEEEDMERIIVKYFKLCPNLNSFEMVKLNWVYELFSDCIMKICNDYKKTGFTVSTLIASACDAGERDQLKKFAEAGNKVVDLSLSIMKGDSPEEKQKVGEWMNKMIHSSRDVMNKLRVSYLCDKPTLSISDQLSKLHELELDVSLRANSYDGAPLFGPNFDFKYCPRLRRVKIYLTNSGQTDYLERLFGSCGIASSVKELWFENSYAGLVTTNELFKTFSEIEKLSISINNRGSAAHLSLVPVYNSCKKLRFLQVTESIQDVPDFYLHFLTQMTGFSVDTCKTIFNSVPDAFKFQGEEPPVVKGLRVAPSILDLPALRTLHVNAERPGLNNSIFNESKARRLAKMFAFDLKPNLNASFGKKNLMEWRYL